MHRLAPTLLLSLAAASCGGATHDDDADAVGGVDALEATAQTQALLSIVNDVTRGAVGAEMAAAVAAQNTAGAFLPSGCVQATSAGATVTYTLNGCAGAYGLASVSGTLRATFSEVTPSGRTVALSGELQANGLTLRPDATAQVSFMGSSRMASVTVMGTGTTPRPSAFAQSGSYMSTWDGACLGLTGRVSNTASSGGAVTVDITNFRRCRGGCPDAGGRVTVTSARGASVTLTFNGAATATLSGSRGRNLPVRLYCGS
ncbi:MAG: hypothetical protein R3A48_22310 [Polyangiales bacterium]